MVRTRQFLSLLLGMVRATTACTFSTSQLPKVVREWCVSFILTWKCASTSQLPKVVRGCGALYMLTWKCASRHNGVHCCDSSTSNSGPRLVCCVHFELRATTPCTFSTSQLPKVVRSWCVLYILTWTCASCHNDVQFFISHLARWLRTRRFREVLFDPPEPQISGKTQ